LHSFGNHSREVAVVTTKVENWRFPQKNFLCHAAITKRIRILEWQWQLRSTLNVATSYITLVRFSAVTAEKIAKIGHIWLIISEHVQPISTNYSPLIDIWVGIINLTLVLRYSRDVAIVTN